ncbi:MAG: DUF2796 domain-containing protein [Woeseiaceae bacterium]|nr:DUF2796 domain-containing protein [Woeseiaceae bacterium]
MKILPALILVVGIAPASAVAQHVHGVVDLGIVVEDDTVAVTLSAPLSDVVGFEHEPKNDEQAKLIQRAAKTLSDPVAMFGLARSANCEFSDMAIDGPDYVLRHLAQAGDAPDGHGDDHDDHHGHDEDHDKHDHDDHNHDKHGHNEHEAHAEVTASYEWSCSDASGLDALELRFTEAFAGVEMIKIQILTAAGAQVLTREGRVGSVSLSSP